MSNEAIHRDIAALLARGVIRVKKQPTFAKTDKSPTPAEQASSCKSFPNAEGLFVANRLFLDRHPDLPRVLIDNRFRMDVSQRGRAPEYMKRIRVVRQ